MTNVNHRSPLRSVVLGLALLSVTTTVADSNDECPCKLLDRPSLRHKAETARWMVHSLDWGVLSTISTRLGDDGAPPIPFGNVYSFVDGTCDSSTGIPYFYGTYKDQSFQDTIENAAVSLTLSEASLASVCGGSNLKGCRIGGGGFGDPENPLCARLVLTGTFTVIDDDELDMAKAAIFERHASMEQWPTDHEWVVAKLEISDIWLIDFFGGASILNVDDYLAIDLVSSTPLQESH
eukprot:CAMPEP_0119004608 /NCGR_PEP_ID=MMETSP1176-20130426/1247_1 /TAXON_ID=265551 /ORGANISM="Synedropsis recta cf, Strain CCMP1620" /LENGTH=235 /DNA_ID=CAMNT_0006956337 /DNA_START=22 /DNA_END=729 /DNA_ORIENTATION=-